MERIPAPTLDQITGYTVMEKMRSLIKNYVATTTQIIDRVEDTVTQEEIATYLEQYLSDYYTKEEVDEIIENLDLTDYYTKSETDTLLSAKANANNVYTKSEVYNKTETDNLLSAKANSNNVYTKSESDTLLSAKANANNVYTKSESDTLLSAKANANNVYTKSETDNLLSAKANASNVYTKSETDNLLSDKQDELTAGTGITIQNNVISATGGSSSENWVLVGENDWATYVQNDIHLIAKEDLKVRYQFNNAVKGEYYVYKNYSVFETTTNIFYSASFVNNKFNVLFFVSGFDATDRNSVTANRFYYDLKTVSSDGTVDVIHMGAYKVHQTNISNYFEIYHKV